MEQCPHSIKTTKDYLLKIYGLCFTSMVVLCARKLPVLQGIKIENLNEVLCDGVLGNCPALESTYSNPYTEQQRRIIHNFFKNRR